MSHKEANTDGTQRTSFEDIGLIDEADPATKSKRGTRDYTMSDVDKDDQMLIFRGVAGMLRGRRRAEKPARKIAKDAS